jgi:NhaP-type Na+/H+ or K+/H+ antiporter
MGLFGISWGFLIAVFAITAFVGAIVGVCSGFLASRVHKTRQSTWTDASLGGLAALAGWFGSILLEAPHPLRTA